MKQVYNDRISPFLLKTILACKTLTAYYARGKQFLGVVLKFCIYSTPTRMFLFEYYLIFSLIFNVSPYWLHQNNNKQVNDVTHHKKTLKQIRNQEISGKNKNIENRTRVHRYGGIDKPNAELYGC